MEDGCNIPRLPKNSRQQSLIGDADGRFLELTNQSIVEEDIKDALDDMMRSTKG